MKMLIGLLEGASAPGETVLLGCELAVRESAGPKPNHKKRA